MLFLTKLHRLNSFGDKSKHQNVCRVMENVQNYGLTGFDEDFSSIGVDSWEELTPQTNELESWLLSPGPPKTRNLSLRSSVQTKVNFCTSAEEEPSAEWRVWSSAEEEASAEGKTFCRRYNLRQNVLALAEYFMICRMFNSDILRTFLHH